jgi:hypothetical protein
MMRRLVPSADTVLTAEMKARQMSLVTYVQGVALCMPDLLDARKYAEDREEYRDRHHDQD